MLDLILTSLYFILPAYAANMAPPVFAKFTKTIPTPINAKLFGSHKTYRGFFGGYITAFITLLIQLILSKQNLLHSYEIINYQTINIFLYAFLFGFGALTGDLIKSYFKRSLNILPGRPFIPFDQIDFILGAFIFLAPFHVLMPNQYLAILIITPILNFFVNILAYALKLKKVWW